MDSVRYASRKRAARAVALARGAESAVAKVWLAVVRAAARLSGTVARVIKSVEAYIRVERSAATSRRVVVLSV